MVKAHRDSLESGSRPGVSTIGRFPSRGVGGLAKAVDSAHIAAKSTPSSKTTSDPAVSALANRRFLKMNGLGNEIVIVDLRGSDWRLSAEEARAVAAEPRSRFDQLMAVHDPVTPGTDAYLRIYNTDGSESAACGNGTRCVAWAMLSDPMMARPAGETPFLETAAGILPTTREGDLSFTVDMGAPRLRWSEIPLRDPYPDTRAIDLRIGPAEAPLLSGPAVVNMGNPHAIFFVEDVAGYDLGTIGP